MDLIKLTLTVRRQPYCPCCGIALQHFSFRFCCGCSFCAACVRVVPTARLVEIADILRHRMHPRQTTGTHGLTWWTPQDPHPKMPLDHLFRLKPEDFEPWHTDPSPINELAHVDSSPYPDARR